MLEMMTSNLLKKISEPGLEIDPEVFQKLLASDGAAGDRFGWSVATSEDGSIVIVGSYKDDDKGTDSGSVYIFTKQANDAYLQSQKLLATDGAAYDNFGNSVAISGDSSTIVVGAYGDDDKGADSGSVYIFTQQANGSYLQSQKLVASDGTAYDNFGNSLAISDDGSVIVTGAHFDNDKGDKSGSAYVFTKQANGSYLETQKLMASDGAANDVFGYSVAISGDSSTIIVGAYGDGDRGSSSGSVYIFTQQAIGNYLQIQKLVALDGAAYDYFGISVATSENGSTIVVGAYYDGDKGPASGSAYIFTKQANGNYLQIQKLVAADGIAFGNFGYSVATSSDGSTIVVGATGDDDKGESSGSVYVFTKKANGSYLQTQKLVALDGEGNDMFGWGVAVSQTSVVVGAQNHLDKGAVYIY